MSLASIIATVLYGCMLSSLTALIVIMVSLSSLSWNALWSSCAAVLTTSSTNRGFCSACFSSWYSSILFRRARGMLENESCRASTISRGSRPIFLPIRVIVRRVLCMWLGACLGSVFSR